MKNTDDSSPMNQNKTSGRDNVTYKGDSQMHIQINIKKRMFQDER